MASITAWEQVAAQLSNQTDIKALVEYNGDIYGGTSRDASADGARMFKLTSPTWTQVAGKLGTEQYIQSMITFDDGSGEKIYAGTYPGGRLWRSSGGAFTEVAGQLSGNESEIQSMLIYDNGAGDDLYAGVWFSGKLIMWDGVSAWVQKAPQHAADANIYALIEYKGDLLAGTGGGDTLKWDGVNSWIVLDTALPGTATGISDFLIYDSGSGDNLYCSSFSGSLFLWDDVSEWSAVGGATGGSWSIVEYDGNLYMSTYKVAATGTGELWIWNDVDTLTKVAAELNGQEHTYDLTVFNNRLYCGTGNGGRLFRAVATGLTKQVMLFS